jgi:transposase
VGFEDETWWSRVALPSLRTWREDGKPSRLVQHSVAKDDPDPKAVSCYGLYVPEFKQTWLRFVEGRPVSGITTRFISWCSEGLASVGKKVLVLVWDNASWHVSKEVRRWIGDHNREVKKGGKRGVRLISCYLPTKIPWLNPIEPKKWMHGKRRVAEADGPLSAHELAERVCSAFGCPASGAPIPSRKGRLSVH